MNKDFIHQGKRPNLISTKVQTPQGNQKFQPLPQPVGNPPYHLSLENVLSADEIQKIVHNKYITFHCVGDTGGVKSPAPQILVANALENTEANFFYHLGDVVYYNGESEKYYDQFYDPYQYYIHPIFAIPGNHDGDPLPSSGESSLEAFVRNFCSRSTEITKDAGDVNKSPMTQPNVYWTLKAPFVTIVGLYTNVPEGGQVEKEQIEWFENELKTADKTKALIVALHHPIFSMDRMHSGSQSMLDLIDNAVKNTNVIPDAVFTAHVHNYQRFTRTYSHNIDNANSRNNKKQVPFIVAGAGGYWNLHWMQKDIQTLPLPIKVPERDDVILEKYCDDHHGFMRIKITQSKIIGEYYTVPNPHESWHDSLNPKQFDAFEIDLFHK
ncbi:MAG: metallophosphoesterase family protein [Candidatus Nitrosocosmicus sp.]